MLDNMVLNVTMGATRKPAAATELVSAMTASPLLDGELIIGYPNLGGDADDAVAEALWVSAQHGAVLFDVIEGTDLGDHEKRQDDIFRLYHSRLMQNRELVKGRKLIAEPQVVTFAPGLRSAALPKYVANTSTLLDVLPQLEAFNLAGTDYRTLLSAAQNVSSIRRGRQTRVTKNADSRGSKLLNLENSIATLDAGQQRAVIETIDGVQRIRGLAGSGKTIILALKVAYLHGRHPEWRIAVTFYTRALKEQFRRLITTFCLEQNSAEPDWDRIHIINAWGGRGGIDRSGIYKQFCDANNLTYYDLQSAKAEFGSNRAFDGAVKTALESAHDPKPLYDVILVDEAQDFPSAFLRLCYEMLPESRRLVYAYDEMQDLTGSGVPEPELIFGSDKNGNPRVSLEPTPYDLGARRDVVLEKCYRNSRPLLVAAHAIGFGIYREPDPSTGTGLVQMFAKPDRWRDIGYHVSDGQLAAGDSVTLARSPESSPKFLEEHSTLLDLVESHRFESPEAQNRWVAEQIKKNLEDDELRHDDIMVISPNPFTARAKLGPLRKALLEVGVDNHIAGVDSSTDTFFVTDKDSVTFSGINRAKGNEAGMVYILNAEEELGRRPNQTLIRNRLFTAITRSKAWVRICGVGEAMQPLLNEIDRIREAQFQLSFTYPTAEQLKTLRLVHREVSAPKLKKIADADRSVQELLAGLQLGTVAKEDLDPATLADLRAFLSEAG